jgi:hypothetical protein
VSADIILLPATEGPLKGVSFVVKRPPDCLPHRWTIAVIGLRRFIAEGWGDQALALGWTPIELFRLPELWSQIWLCGTAWLIGEAHVVAVIEAGISIEMPSGTRLKFRRAGQEHLP